MIYECIITEKSVLIKWIIKKYHNCSHAIDCCSFGVTAIGEPPTDIINQSLIYSISNIIIIVENCAEILFSVCRLSSRLSIKCHRYRIVSDTKHRQRYRQFSKMKPTERWVVRRRWCAYDSRLKCQWTSKRNFWRRNGIDHPGDAIGYPTFDRLPFRWFPGPQPS